MILSKLGAGSQKILKGGLSYSSNINLSMESSSVHAQIPTELYYGHQVAFASKDEFTKKLYNFKTAGACGLRIVSDFDFTMTKFYLNGKRGASCHKVIEDCGLLSEDYHVQAQALQQKYYPLEVDPTIDLEQKTKFMIEWVDQAHVLLAEYGLTKQTINKAVHEALETGRIALRESMQDFFTLTSHKKIPMLIFSAGIADVLEEVLHTKVDIDWNHLHVISNRCIFNPESGVIQDFQQPLLHVFNKKSSPYLHTTYFQTPGLDERHHVLLLGDSLGDISMSDGMNIPDENILRVGFLNDRVERLPHYLEKYDVVILGDPDFTVPLRLLQVITEHH